jgi:hypothetical protein
VVVILHKVTNYLLKYKVFIDISAMIAQFVEGLTINDYISRKGRKGRRVIFLTVNAGAGGVAVTRDRGRRGG